MVRNSAQGLLDSVVGPRQSTNTDHEWYEHVCGWHDLLSEARDQLAGQRDELGRALRDDPERATAAARHDHHRPGRGQVLDALVGEPRPGETVMEWYARMTWRLATVDEARARLDQQRSALHDDLLSNAS